MRLKHKSLISLFLIVILAVVILLLPFLLRYSSNNPLFVRSSYYNIRASEDLSKGLYWDYLQDRPHEINLFTYIASTLSSLGTNFLIMFSIILCVVSIIVFYLILTTFISDRNQLYIAIVLFVASPMFLFLFTSLGELSLAVCLSLLLIYLVLRKSFLSIPFLALISITSFSFFIIDLVLLCCYYFYDNDYKYFIVNSVFSLIVVFLFSYLHHGFQVFSNLFLNPSFTKFFTSFGADSGIAFFYLFLGLIGFFMGWNRKKEFFYVSVSFVLVFIFSLFNVSGRVFLNFYLCVFSSITLFYLIKRTWAIPMIKQFTLLLIVCGIIFSTALYIDQLLGSEPSKELVDSLIFLESKSNGNVFSHQKYGFFVEYFSKKKSFLDDNSRYSKDYFSLKDAEQKIFYSRNLNTTMSALNDYNIKYLLITVDMKQGLVWKRESEGLLFFLENSINFNRLWSNKNVEIWEILYNV